MKLRQTLLLCMTAPVLAGCLTDPATRLAYDIERGASQLSREDGSRHKVEHRTPSKAGECEGPYTVQLDKAGALIIWCRDAIGATVSSHSTSYQSRFIDTPQTWILEKTAGTTLNIILERRGDRAVVVELR